MAPDWISLWWQATVTPGRFDVAGVTVGPLSVWHTFALENVGNAYLCGGNPSRDDAACLLLFASTDKAGGRKLMLMPNHRRRRMVKMHKLIKRVPIETLHAACMEYVEICMRSADRFEKDGETGKPSAAPYQFHIVRSLCGEYGYTDNQAWNAPYNLARCYFDAAAESNGDNSLASQKAQHYIDTKEEQ